MRNLTRPLMANHLLGTGQSDMRCKHKDETKSQEGTVSQSLLSLGKGTRGRLARLLNDNSHNLSPVYLESYFIHLLISHFTATLNYSESLIIFLIQKALPRPPSCPCHSSGHITRHFTQKVFPQLLRLNWGLLLCYPHTDPSIAFTTLCWNDLFMCPYCRDRNVAPSKGCVHVLTTGTCEGELIWKTGPCRWN